MGGLVPAAQVLLMSQLVTSLGSQTGDNGTARIPLFLALLAVVSASAQILGALKGNAFQAATGLVTTELSTQVMSQAIGLSPAQTERPDILDSMQRATRESQFRPTQAMQQTLDVVGQLTTVASVGAVLSSMHPGVAVLALFAPCPLIYAQLVAGRLGFELEQGRAEDRRRLVYWPMLLTDPSSAKEIHAFGVGAYIVEQFRSVAQHIVQGDLSLFRRITKFTVSMSIVSVALNLAAQFVALWVALSAGNVGILIAVIQGIVAIQAAGMGMFGGLASLSNTQMYLSNIRHFLSIQRESPIRGDRTAPSTIENGIEFRQVCFTYPGQSWPALTDVSFVLRAGDVTAIMGRNGAGKSTLFKLLCGIYSPDSGEILIDGIPIQEMSEDSLLSTMTFVFQDFVEYNVSASDNVGLGSLSHIDDVYQIQKSATMAGVAEDLARLPSGWATSLGKMFDSGIDLSGGQWQKVAIARSLMRDVPIMLLDEPTSSLDPISERAIFEQLRLRSPAGVRLIIAHRFSTVRFADHVIVMDKGAVVAQGRHLELMDSSTLYSDLYEAQEFSVRS
jgi:ATP-binding cassette subfamily B protein